MWQKLSILATKVNSSVADGLTLAELVLVWSICQSEVGCGIISFESLSYEIEGGKIVIF